MPNDFHNLLTGPDLHPNKTDATTGTKLTVPSQSTYDARWKAPVDAHVANTGNPHAVTAAQVGSPPATRTIATTAPITGGGNLTADRTLSIPAATASANGYLTSADWATFNAKGSKNAVVVGPGGSTGSDYTGDGTSDHTAIQSAIKSVTFSSPQIVRLNPGTYNLSGVFNFNGRKVLLIGAGKGKTIIRANAGFLASGLLYDFLNASDCLLEGITFDMNNQPEVGAILMGASQNITIWDCEFKNTGGASRWSVLIGDIDNTNTELKTSDNIRFMHNDMHDNNNGTNETYLAINQRNSRCDSNNFWNNSNSAYTVNFYG